MRRTRVVVMTLVLLLALTLPALAQDVPAVEGGEAIVLPGWLLGLLGLLVTAGLGGLLLVISRAMTALRESYPAGTVDQVTAAVADGLERILTQLKASAPATETNVDDFLLNVTEPLAKAIIEALRGASPTPPPAASPPLGDTLGAMHAVEQAQREG